MRETKSSANKRARESSAQFTEENKTRRILMVSSVAFLERLTVEASSSKAGIWAGRIISVIVVLFLIFDAAMKLIKEPHVLAASADLGYPVSSIVLIGAILLGCTLVYVIPRTSILGAVLLTGYLGGALASNLRVGHPVFQCIFPIIFGALVWVGLLLRDARLREMTVIRKH
jgi:hypothetical protein